jgi:hypothetical protein
MLLFIVFGIYVIVKRKVHITRSWSLTGENAQTFGALLVATPILVFMFQRQVLRYVVSAQVLNHPITGRLIVYATLAACLLSMAFLLRDKKSR